MDVDGTFLPSIRLSWSLYSPYQTWELHYLLLLKFRVTWNKSWRQIFMDVLAWPTRKYDSGSNHLVCLPCMQTCLARFALEHSKVDLLFSGFRPFLRQFSNRSKLMSTQTLKPHKVPPKVRHTTQWRAFLFKSSGKSTECTPRPIHTKKYSKSWESWVTPPWLLSTYYGQLDISRGSFGCPRTEGIWRASCGQWCRPSQIFHWHRADYPGRKQEYLVVAGEKDMVPTVTYFPGSFEWFQGWLPNTEAWKRRLPMAIWHWPQQMVETNHMMLMSSIHSSSWPLKANNLCFQQTFVKNHQISFHQLPIIQKKITAFSIDLPPWKTTPLLLTNLCLS